MDKLESIFDELTEKRSLSLEDYVYLIENRTAEITDKLASKARELCNAVYGNEVYIRAIIEIGNVCKNDCYYCGIRRSNTRCERYRLTKEDILACCEEGYPLGFRTFVLQGGEDDYFTDLTVCETVSEIKSRFPDCAVTLSLGEKTYESYKSYRLAGADRYLLRHETADKAHYAKLHPEKMSFDNRMRCLTDLRRLGYQTGCGFMVGSPFQTSHQLGQDLKFIERFKPDMCGIGPFISHKDTPFCNMPNGTVELTCFLLSVIRIMLPDVLLPATTALGTLAVDGRERGILSGANVVMPNLTPESVREKYSLYDNKLCTGSESAKNIKELERRMEAIGYRIAITAGNKKDYLR